MGEFSMVFFDGFEGIFVAQIEEGSNESSPPTFPSGSYAFRWVCHKIGDIPKRPIEIWMCALSKLDFTGGALFLDRPTVIQDDEI